MFWAVIVTFWVEDGVKIDSEGDENAPSHASRHWALRKLGIKDSKLMVWPPYSPDLSPIENL